MNDKQKTNELERLNKEMKNMNKKLEKLKKKNERISITELAKYTGDASLLMFKSGILLMNINGKSLKEKIE